MNRRETRSSTSRSDVAWLLGVMLGLTSFADFAKAIDVQAAGLRQDATLRDVAFLNPEDGWAVGDAGTLLRTDDGGAVWTEMASDSVASLTGVAFADRRRGLVVGWKLSPYTHRASAEALSTSDGGENWIRQTNDSRTPAAEAARLMPGLLGVTASSEELAAFGFPNLHSRTGLSPWSGPTLGFRREGVDRRSPIVAAIRAERGPWLFVDPSGAVSRLRESGLTIVPFGEGEPPVAKALACDGPLVVVAGSDGFAAISNDSGDSFRVVQPLSDELRRLVHWKTAAVRGESVWLAGTPGSIVAKSDDAGASWRIVATGDPLPIEKMFFLDRSQGWAVGALGTIRRSVDGGQTWMTVRGSNRAAALAGFSTSPSEAPFEASIKHATVDGYRSVQWVAADVDDEAAWQGPSSASRLAFACGSCGAGSVENLAGRSVPSGAMEDPLAALARGRAEGIAETEAIDRLAVWIRAWRPEATIVPAPPALGGTPADGQMHRIALAAAEKAADPQFDVAAMKTLGLPAWQTKRIASPSLAADAPVQVSGNAYAAPARQSLAEVALELRSYLDREPPREWNSVVRFAEIRRSSPRPASQDLFADLPGVAGNARRRDRGQPDAEALRQHQEAIPWRRSFEALAHPDAAADENFAARFDDVVRRTEAFDAPSAGVALRSTACLAAARGRDDLADAAWRRLVARDPQGPLAEYACLRLATARASVERLADADRALERRLEAAEERRSSALPGVESFELPRPESDPLGESVRDDDLEYRGVSVAPGTMAFGPVPVAVSQTIDAAELGVSTDDAEANAAYWTDQLNREAPWSLAWARPQFAAWAVGRSQGQSPLVGAGGSTLSAALPPTLATFVDADVTARPEAFLAVERAERPPYLDGKLVEGPWSARPLFESSRGDRLGIAFDDEHVFIAYQAPPRPPSDSATARRAPSSRRRDATVVGSERLLVVIDVDGDALSTLRFEIDRFGRCREALDGDTAWNPRWFAASDAGARSWSVEAAIPRSPQWAGRSRSAMVSAIGVYRIVPGEGAYDVLSGGLADDVHLPVRRVHWMEGAIAMTAEAPIPAAGDTALESVETPLRRLPKSPTFDAVDPARATTPIDPSPRSPGVPTFDPPLP